MTTNKFEAIFTEEEQKEINMTIALMGFAGTPCPIKTEEELIEFGKKIIAEEKAKAEKKAETKAKKLANETKKAEEAGMTFEEYQKEKKRLAKVRAIKREIETLEKELTEKREYLKKLEG